MALRRFGLFALSLGAFLSGCVNEDQNVVSRRYIHRYGYDVSPAEWEAQHYPGQVMTLMRDGSTIVESFEDNMLHGLRTETYPHSQTVHFADHFERGTLKKRVTYTLRGIPEKEELFMAHNHTKTTLWFTSGNPRAREEWSGDRLISAEYFSPNGETEARLDKSSGKRILRDTFGLLLSMEYYNNGDKVHVETFYPNQNPHTIASYRMGNLHGTFKSFAPTGEPLAIEEYVNGKLSGTASYFQNGSLYLELSYKNGMRHGPERHFIDGKTMCSETLWNEDQKHGPAIVCADGIIKTTYYYFNQKVTKTKFDEMIARLDMLTSAYRKTDHSEEMA